MTQQSQHPPHSGYPGPGPSGGPHPNAHGHQPEPSAGGGGYPPNGGHAPWPGQPQPGAYPPGQPMPGYTGQPMPGYAGQPMPGYAPGRPPEYEFSPPQNEIIAAAGNEAKKLGILYYVVAAMSLVSMNFVAALIDGVIGYQLHEGSKELDRVVTTQGNDISALMSAFDKLSSVFLIRLVLFVIFVGIFLFMGLAFSGMILAALAEAMSQMPSG